MIIPDIVDMLTIISISESNMNNGERNIEIMETKYGTITKEQFEEYKKQLHGMIHWLLVYREKNYDDLDNYFSSVLFRINGFNSVLNYPPNMLTLMATLEAARLENQNPNFDHKKYRKAILDAHAIVDKIGMFEENKNTEESEQIQNVEEVVETAVENVEEMVTQ